MISILLLTYNEESALPNCLKHIDWCDDIVVIDSYSTDESVNICEKAGARIFLRKFDNFAGQRNYGLAEIDFKHEWVFHLDADELFTDELRIECESIVRADGPNGAYLVPSKMMLWGKWLKHAASYPVYQMRFHKIGDALFEQYGHGQRETELKRGLGTLCQAYEHHSFEKGLGHWFNRHNQYSTDEALQSIELLKKKSFSVNKLFSRNILERRRSLKQLSYKLPFRWFIKFLYLFIMKRGFLDGRAGFTYCSLHACYEHMIVVKQKEILLSKGQKFKNF
ncbi:MAG: glycosyltransferase family 2 protein [Lentisphaeria bacterium]|nr:glycosyltransferase family 2 protein [Lentisphaeria bacterium]